MRLHKLSLLFLSFLTALIFIGCEDNSVDVGENSEQLISATDYALMDEAEIMTDLGEATTTQNMEWGANVPQDSKRKFLKPRPKRIYFGKILRELELSDEQHTQIKSLIEGHRTAAKSIHEDFKLQVQDIIDSAKAERDEIVEKMKAEEITKEEARELLKVLNEETKAEIESTEAYLNAKAELCVLKKELVEEITLILTEEQKTEWNNWLDNLEDDCLNG